MNNALVSLPVQDLPDAAIDWLALRAFGFNAQVSEFAPAGVLVLFSRKSDFFGASLGGRLARPTTDWAVGGPLLGRLFNEGLAISSGDNGRGGRHFTATLPGDPSGAQSYTADSALKAALLCKVLLEYGPEVEVPAALAQSPAPTQPPSSRPRLRG